MAVAAVPGDVLRLPAGELKARSLRIGDVVVRHAGRAMHSSGSAVYTLWLADPGLRTGLPTTRTVRLPAGHALCAAPATAGLVRYGQASAAESVSVWTQSDDAALESPATRADALSLGMCGIAVCAGCRVHIDAPSGQCEVVVTAVTPASAKFVRVLPSTRIVLVPPPTPAPAAEQPLRAAAAASAGGQHEVEADSVHAHRRSGLRAQPGVEAIARVRALCTHCAEAATSPAGAARALARPVRCILLHGPPGVGKSHLVRALCAEQSLPLHVLEVATLGADERAASRAVQRVFARAARHATALQRSLVRARAAEPGHRRATGGLPCVISADEIDAVCAARLLPDGGLSDGPEGVGATLLAQIDAMPADGRLLVIGATNRLPQLAPALLRAGRADVQIALALGMATERERVLVAVAAHMRLAPDVDLGELARRTCAGFSVADCAALCREAALHALRAATPPGGEQAASLADSATAAAAPAEAPAEAEPMVNAEDFAAARARVRPTVVRALSLEVRAARWEDVGGQAEAKASVRAALEWPLTRAAAMRRLGVRGARGVLLHGPPGCAKTLLARAVATSLDATFLYLSGASVYSALVGEAEATVRSLFATARACAPALVFLDELDALVGDRARASDGGDSVQQRVLSTLLTELDGVEASEGVVLIGATNRKDLLDAALLRPGRLDAHIHVGLPDADARADVLRVHTGRMPLARDVDLVALAARAHGLSGADLAQLCVQAALAALRRAQRDGGDAALGKALVASHDFAEALACTMPSVRDHISMDHGLS